MYPVDKPVSSGCSTVDKELELTIWLSTSSAVQLPSDKLVYRICSAATQ